MMLSQLIYTAHTLVCIYIFVIRGDEQVTCKVCKCSHDITFGGVLVNCSDRGFSTLPVKIPERTTTLVIAGNDFTELRGQMFVRQRNLKRLDVSRNALRQLSADAFLGLSHLRELNLESNKLTLNVTTFTENLFKPLYRLQILRLNNNTNPMYLPPGASYPDSSFQHLSALLELSIDGLPGSFGQGFGNLTHLKNLTLSGSNGYCTLPVLTNSTFTHVPRVQMLNISNCLTVDAEPLTFAGLKNIHTLDVSLNRDLGFDNFSKAMFGLQNATIQVLRMNSIYHRFDSFIRLKIDHVQYLKHTFLKELHIDGDGIVGLQQGTIGTFPPSLEVISARDNKFSFGIYFLELMNMDSLKFLDISYVNKWRTKRDLTLTSHKLRNWFPMRFPLNLETLVISHCYMDGMIHDMGDRNSSLKKIIADHNLITSVFLNILHTYKEIEYVNLSHNLISNIYTDSTLISSLLYLDLTNNDLGKCFSNDIYGEIFKGGPNLQHINISSNRIDFLPKQIFRGLHKVESLVIADNELVDLNISLQHMYYLKYLDLGNNKLQTLSISVRNALDHLNNVTVRLKGNPLSCTCLNLSFLRWIQKHRLKIKDLQSTRCIMTNGTQTTLTDLDRVVHHLEDQCRSYVVFLVTSVSLFILIMMVTSMAFGYRYRWKLRRMYYLGKKKRHSVANDEPDIYTFDAFVSYADADRGFVKDSMIAELEDKADLRLCIHDRDFIPGTVIASNIANAIESSRKTLILLSPSFLKSDWCQFEYNMARAEGVSRRENVVVAVLYRPVQIKDMPRDMAVLFAQYSYLEYDINGHDDDIFWQNIIDALRTPEVNDD